MAPVWPCQSRCCHRWGMGTAGKATLRQRLLAARRSVADEVRAAEAHSLAEQLTRLATNGDTVCAYVPVGAEPGSLEMLDVLRRRVRRVLLPVARTRADDTRCRCGGANTVPAAWWPGGLACSNPLSRGCRRRR
ncbi:5-formyltetrahydrofolate cyclo-ligase family protein [Mycobacterium xenopi 3993]|nr:5-formyltetrahydrofolate cyclo-ligase family protein [Mycobacterium xenopi 3993]